MEKKIISFERKNTHKGKCFVENQKVCLKVRLKNAEQNNFLDLCVNAQSFLIYLFAVLNLRVKYSHP